MDEHIFINETITIALQLVPLLNWLTIVAGALLFGKFLGETTQTMKQIRAMLMELTTKKPSP